MKNYVRLSFVPAGNKGRKRTVWAIEMRPSGNLFRYKVCDREGEAEHVAGHLADGTPIERTEIVLLGSTDSSWKVVRARMNLKYGWLELVR